MISKAGFCDGCHRKNNDPAPMFHDAAWQKLAEKHETLCNECALKRVADRQIGLTLADLKPCAFNLLGWPYSWFDAFRKFEPEVDEVALAQEWRDAMRAHVARIVTADVE
jgi:hypothetical protein